MVETYNLKYDIEVLSTERDALTKEFDKRSRSAQR